MDEQGWRIECAWCKQTIRGDPAAADVSHSICTVCLRKEMDAYYEGQNAEARDIEEVRVEPEGMEGDPC